MKRLKILTLLLSLTLAADTHKLHAIHLLPHTRDQRIVAITGAITSLLGASSLG